MATVVDGAEQLSIKQLAEELGVTPRIIRGAIKRGELAAHLIGGREPRQAGRGLGYRITREAGQAWYFGKDSLPKDGYKPIENKEARPK